MSKEIVHIIDRIKHIKDLQSKSDVARVLGLSKENLHGYEKRNKIPLQAILMFCEKENLSPTFVLYGHSRGERKFGYGQEASIEYEQPETQAVHDPPMAYTTTAERHAEVFAAVKDILESGDDFVIKALKERLADYRVSVSMNRERRGIQQRLARIEQILESSLRGGGMPGGGSPAGPDTPPGEDIIAGAPDTGKKAM